MATYVTTTFSPIMIGPGRSTARVRRIREREFLRLLKAGGVVSAVGHEATAAVMSQKWGINIAANRVNLACEYRDIIIAAIPKFRAEVAREFTCEELENSQFEFFKVLIG